MRIVIVFWGLKGTGCVEYRASSGPFFFCKKSARSGEDRAVEGDLCSAQSLTVGAFFRKHHISTMPPIAEEQKATMLIGMNRTDIPASPQMVRITVTAAIIIQNGFGLRWGTLLGLTRAEQPDINPQKETSRRTRFSTVISF